ncbi:MAG: insulinase family protein, partial [Muribaculaceae bacterium]|nr:insulinase family protein [Muribaculaceae bacterium]
QMTNDNPEWRVFFNMLRCMYHSHPVKIDIAGTIESIAKIDADLLYKCYNTFYNLNNMVLSIAGNIKADEVLAICDEYLKPCEDKGLETVFPEEPETIVQSEIYEKQPVGTPIFHIGYKCTPCSKRERLEKNVAMCIASSLITDVSSDMYQKLLKEGILNSTFGGEIFCGDGYFSVIFAGESNDPEKVRDSIAEEIKKISENGIPEKVFQRIKKSMYGAMIRQLNNVEAVASMMLGAHMSGTNPYDMIDMISEMTSDTVLEYMRRELREDKLVMSVVEGMEND